MIDRDGLESVRAMLAADGYTIDAREEGERVLVEIGATPEACADCLAPPPVLQAVLARSLSVPEDAIDLRHPDDGGGA